MRLGIRLLFAFFLINGIAAFFVLRVFMAEIKPSVREVMEDMMVDTANLLAEVASDDLASGQLARDASQSRFAQRVRHYATRPIDAGIWGFSKQSLDFRVYVTDHQGRVLFDSKTRPWAPTTRSGATWRARCAASTGPAPPARWRATTPAA
jgi:two-component system sensor histidine kinase CreC